MSAARLKIAEGGRPPPGAPFALGNVIVKPNGQIGPEFRTFANALSSALVQSRFHQELGHDTTRLREDLGIYINPNPWAPRTAPTVLGTVQEGFNSLRGDIASLTTEVKELRASQPSPAPPADTSEIASLQREITSLIAEVRELRAFQSSPTPRADPSLRREIASLTAEVRKLRALLSPPAMSRPHERVGRPSQPSTPPPRPMPPTDKKGPMSPPPPPSKSRAAKGKRRREPPEATNEETRSPPKGKKTRQASPRGDSASADTPWNPNEGQAGPTTGPTKNPAHHPAPHFLPQPQTEGVRLRWGRRALLERPNLGTGGFAVGRTAPGRGDPRG
jgi:hypothetical protein